MADNTNTGYGLYPLTKMNFLVTVDGIAGTAAFNEVTGIEASVDVVEFRQGNSASLAPIKIPGLVKHGNVSLKFGYTISNPFKDWVKNCISEQRPALQRQNVTIELIDIQDGAPSTPPTGGGPITWILKNAWVAKYSGSDLNANESAIAIENVELAYEELVVPN